MDVELTVDLAYERRERHDRLAPELETALYRLVQEALMNARRHGEAARTAVAVVEDDAMVTVMVRDDGDGFDPATATRGFGLLGMRERVELLGGTIDIRSAPGDGTVIRAVLPARRRGEILRAMGVTPGGQ